MNKNIEFYSEKDAKFKVGDKVNFNDRVQDCFYMMVIEVIYHPADLFNQTNRFAYKISSDNSNRCRNIPESCLMSHEKWLKYITGEAI